MFEQDQETMDHLLLSCIFSRTMWCKALSAWGHVEWVPRQADRLLPWCSTLAMFLRHQKDINIFMTLVLWETWKHRNVVVFDGATPSMRDILCQVMQVASEWVQAGFFKVDMAPCLSRRVVREY